MPKPSSLEASTLQTDWIHYKLGVGVRISIVRFFQNWIWTIQSDLIVISLLEQFSSYFKQAYQWKKEESVTLVLLQRQAGEWRSIHRIHQMNQKQPTKLLFQSIGIFITNINIYWNRCYPIFYSYGPCTIR